MHSPTTRNHVAYSPRRDIAERFPSWHVGQADLGGVASEMVNCELRLVLFDPNMWPDLDSAYGHVGVHLGRHMHRLDRLTSLDCDEADSIARLWLDRPDDRAKLCESFEVSEFAPDGRPVRPDLEPG